MFFQWNKYCRFSSNKAVYVLFGLLLIFFSCKKDEDPTDDDTSMHTYDPTEYILDIPANFPDMNLSESNPLTVEGIELGRRLYYDPLLSRNGPLEGMSCSSCHLQHTSFTVNTEGTAVLPHVNLGWNNNFLWEGKISGSLEDIMRFEVNEFFEVDTNVLQLDDEYSDMYYEAFGNKQITREKTALAISQFVRTLVSGNSKYDKFLRNEVVLSSEEMRGYLIFFREKGDCFHCHSTPFMTDNTFHNIGLDSVFTGENLGQYNVTGNPSDTGKFKTPTLRNIELTPPYMHDGRFTTLEEVINHYNSGVAHSTTLDPIMTKPGKEFGLLLSEQDKSDLIAFLKTLTDDEFIENQNLSDPFR